MTRKNAHVQDAIKETHISSSHPKLGRNADTDSLVASLFNDMDNYMECLSADIDACNEQSRQPKQKLKSAGPCSEHVAAGACNELVACSEQLLDNACYTYI